MQIASLNYLTKQNFMRPYIRKNKIFADIVTDWCEFVARAEAKIRFEYDEILGYTSPFPSSEEGPVMSPPIEP
jgi:hypothetical protein